MDIITGEASMYKSHLNEDGTSFLTKNRIKQSAHALKGASTLLIALLALVLFACAPSTTPSTAGTDSAAPAAGGKKTLILGAYTTPREAYGEIIPLFQQEW